MFGRGADRTTGRSVPPLLHRRRPTDLKGSAVLWDVFCGPSNACPGGRDSSTGAGKLLSDLSFPTEEDLPTKRPSRTGREGEPSEALPFPQESDVDCVAAGLALEKDWECARRSEGRGFASRRCSEALPLL
jgi:hypothetical protein